MLSSVVDAESGFFLSGEMSKFFGTNEFGLTEDLEVDGGSEAFDLHGMEGFIEYKQTVGGEETKIGLENKVVTKGVKGGYGSDKVGDKRKVLFAGCDDLQAVGVFDDEA